MDGPLIVKVECHSGAAYADRPVAVCVEEKRLPVATILSEERLPTGKHFRVELEDGHVLELSYFESEDIWKATGLV